MRRHERATVLELGARGRLRGAPFELVGRTCVRSSTGGLWNEWTARFDDGRTGFLAEARGTFTLLFERALAPARGALAVGAPLDTGFIVAERGEARRVARWGATFDAPRAYAYADLSSRAGESATIDYGEREPRTFVGERRALAELGLCPRDERPELLPAPASKAPRGLELVFAIGDVGTFGKTRFRVTGALHRSIRVDGARYTWEEYLLFDAAEGFRWLVVSDGHWSLVEGVEPGLVTVTARGATYDGELYEPWSEGTSRVEWAAGELPWEVAIGDLARAKDFVRPPRMLSLEATDDEINWSLGTYISPDAVSKAFGNRALPKPVGRAPNQPRSPRRK